MSTLLEEERVRLGERGPRFVLALRVLALLSALAALTSLWSVERARLRHDLQLAAEPRARPGDQLALRALLFRDLEATEGPSLVTAPAHVRLLDASGRELARAALVATAADTLDGVLQLPATISGAFTLEARSAYGGESLACRRALAVSADAPPAAPVGRVAGPLQQESLGRVRAAGGRTPPDRLLPRIVGGACVPDVRCLMLVWVGEPAASISVQARGGVELAQPPAPQGETAGLVAVWLVVRGPEAELTLEARRDGSLVAERVVRLPVGLGEVALHGEHTLVAGSRVQLTLYPPPGREQVIVDLFRAGRWRATRLLASPAGQVSATLEEPQLALGLLRVQARSDRFSAESSGARLLYVAAPGEGPAAALAAISEAVRREPAYAGVAYGTEFVQQLPAFMDDPQRAAAFLLAPLEALRMPVPAAVSARPAQLSQLARRRGSMRFGVAGALVLSALLVALSMGRRGLRAADEAHAIMAEARGLAPRERGEGVSGNLRERLWVLLLVLAVAAAFLASALLIAAKPLWF